MGPGRGRSGLCGERSIHFFVFPVLAWAVARARPDLVVHVVVENAGLIRPEHQDAMLAALGLRQDSGHAQIFDAARWTSMPRRRTFFQRWRRWPKAASSQATTLGQSMGAGTGRARPRDAQGTQYARGAPAGLDLPVCAGHAAVSEGHRLARRPTSDLRPAHPELATGGFASGMAAH